MAKSKRTRRASNKIDGSLQGALVTADPFFESSDQPSAVWISRTTIFNAELEEVIEIIARERVYRAMLDRLGRRLLNSPFDRR